MRRTAIALALAFVVQVALVGWTVAERARILANGTEIWLTVVPVDPRDLIRGHYVTLSYAISRLDSDALAGDDDFDWGDTIYVTIAEDADGRWQATAINHVRPDGGTVLMGVVATASQATGASCEGGAPCWTYRVAYNLERFYVPEATAHELERLPRDRVMTVDVAVLPDGRAALKRLRVDGEVRFEEGLF